jgi:GNAT superfamily N-acetyltransferase
LAWDHNEPVAYWRIRGPNPSAAQVLNDPGTASVKGAFTKEPFRGRGIGIALLNHSIEWAKQRGYVRYAVDFEPQNSEAKRFWLKHFNPVCYTLIRRLQGGA